MNATEDALGVVPENSNGDFELLDAGAYGGLLRDILTVKKPDFMLKGEEGEETMQREWQYELTEPGFEGYKIKDWTSLSFHPKSHGFARACALYGRDIEPGETIYKSLMLNKPCQVVVKVYTSAKSGEKRNAVDTVLPPRKRRPALVPRNEETEAEDLVFP